MRTPALETFNCPCGKTVTRIKNTSRVGKREKFCSVKCRALYTAEKFNYKAI